MKKLWILALLCSVLATTACKNTYEGMKTVKTGALEDTKKIRARVAYNISPEYYGKPTEEVTGQYVYPQTFCYNTWTDPVCYDELKEGEDPHLVGR